MASRGGERVYLECGESVGNFIIIILDVIAIISNKDTSEAEVDD